MNKVTKQIAFFLLVGLIIMAIFRMSDSGNNKVTLDYSVFIEKAKNGEISKVRIDNNKKISGKYKNSEGKGSAVSGGDGFDFIC